MSFIQCVLFDSVIIFSKFEYVALEFRRRPIEICTFEVDWSVISFLPLFSRMILASVIAMDINNLVLSRALNACFKCVYVFLTLASFKGPC